MGHQETVNFIVMLGVSALMAMEALAAWRRLRFAGGRALSLALMVGALESLCYALVFWLGQGPGMVHLAAIYAVTGPLLGAFWLIFAVRFAGTRLPCLLYTSDAADAANQRQDLGAIETP